MNRMKTFAAAGFALLLAAACGSMGNYGTGSTNRSYDLRGTVDSVDLSSRSIYLINVSQYGNALAPGGVGSTARVFFDNSTAVNYQGRTYRPQDLERGDQVSIHVNQNGSELMAQSMDVLYNSRDGMASSTVPPYGQSSLVHGTVRSVDTYARIITVDPGYGPYITVNYSSNTPVYLNGRTYMPSDLQVGDQVDIRTTDLGGGRIGAQDITVTQSISNNNNPYGTQISTFRGTVRYVDPTARTIVVDNPTWISGVQVSAGRTMTVQYDSSAQVGYQGQLYPVTNLEPGDIIDVQVQDLGGTSFLAQQISVFRSVR